MPPAPSAPVISYEPIRVPVGSGIGPESTSYDDGHTRGVLRFRTIKGVRGIYLASVWVHILAAMTWAGGMVAFVALVMPYFRRQPEATREDFLKWFGPRFETVSWICLAVLVATGTFNLWARGVQPSDFLRPEWRATAFARLLMLKLGLVALAVVITAVHGRTATHGQARWLGRALLIVGLAIILAAVMLVRAL